MKYISFRHARSKQPPAGSPAFTIVELLIVVVVIAILAAITIVAYNGITNRAKDAALKSELSTYAKKLETTKATSTTNAYPASLSEMNLTQPTGKGKYGVMAGGRGYCLDTFGYDNSVQVPYVISQDAPTPVKGACGFVSGLAGWYSLDGDGRDKSGGGNDGQATNVTSTAGVGNGSNTALSFNGTNSQVLCGTSADLRPTSALTVTAWVNLAAAPSSDVGIVDNGTSGTQGYRVSVDSSRRLKLQVGNRASTIPQAMDIGRWYFVALRFDTGQMQYGRHWLAGGGSISGNMGSNGSVGSGSIPGYSATPCQIGSIASSAGSYINGKIDDVRIYNRVLSDEEISDTAWSQGYFAPNAL